MSKKRSGHGARKTALKRIGTGSGVKSRGQRWAYLEEFYLAIRDPSRGLIPPIWKARRSPSECDSPHQP